VRASVRACETSSPNRRRLPAALQLLQAPLERHAALGEPGGDAGGHRPDRPPDQPRGLLLRLPLHRGLRRALRLPGWLLHPARGLQPAGT